MTLNIGNHTLDLSTPAVMAIINVTTDSFFTGSRTMTRRAIRNRAARAAEEGAAILDVGGYSSRPGAKDIPEKEELSRVLRAVEAIRDELPDMPLSLDTFRSGVAGEVVKFFGPCIINDISAGEADGGMWEVAAAWNLPYIAMHMRGTPVTMAGMCDYTDVVAEVRDYLAGRVRMLREAGIEQVVIDPGYGFAKTTEQNFALLRGQRQLLDIGAPILAGISRKGMIWKTLDITPSEALNGTTALNWEALRGGASIIRVHDTREAVETVRLFRECYPEEAATNI